MNRLAEQYEGRPSKKPRASTPKVKTGCITCKQRRVKCDETKPQCLRCANFGRACGGYVSKEDTPPPKEPSPSAPRKLLSKTTQSGSSSTSPSSASGSFDLVARPAAAAASTPLPPGVTFQDKRDYQFFCHFRDVTSIQLAAGFEPRLWNTLVIQACENIHIRQLIIAVAALHVSHLEGKGTCSKFPLRENEQDFRHEYALKMYGEALKGIREMVSTGQDSLRIALISALLTFCFETLHGDLNRTLMQIESAVDMIVKWLSSTPMPYHFHRIKGPEPQYPRPIDDDLLLAFVRLDRPSITSTNSRTRRPDRASRIFNLLFEDEQLDIPANFASIGDARTFLEDISWRIVPRHRWRSDEETSYSFALETTSDPSFRLPACLSYQLAKWHDAFSPLLNHALSEPKRPIFIAAISLHIQALSTDIFLNGPQSNPYSHSRSSSVSEIRSDEYNQPFGGSPSTSFAMPGGAYPPSSSAGATELQTYLGIPSISPTMQSFTTPYPLVRALLDFSRRLIAHPKFVRSFVFDTAAIPALMGVVELCSDRLLRNEAMELLRSMGPRREGFWDAQLCADVAEASISNE